MTDLLNTPDLRPLLLAIVDANPDRTNPRNENGCVYHGPDDTHCLIGTLAVEQGWTLPSSADKGGGLTALIAAEQYEWPVTVRARQWLRWVQAQADSRDDDGNPRTWNDPKIRAEILSN